MADVTHNKADDRSPFERFQQTLKSLLGVSKQELNEELRAEKSNDEQSIKRDACK